jgi:hypothetical protein
MQQVMWSRKCEQVLTVCCPGGSNDRSQAIYCLERVQSRIRPVGHGLIPFSGLINRPNRGAPIGANHTVPYGTVPFSHRYQAINCLATFITSLRDKDTNFRSHIKPRSALFFEIGRPEALALGTKPFEDEEDDEGRGRFGGSTRSVVKFSYR